MVSTISDVFCHKLGLEIWPLEELVRLEGADGQSLKYLGYTETELKVKELPELSGNILVLVVPETAYRSHVPVLIGTNVLQVGSNENEVRSNVPRPWKLALGSLTQSQKVVSRPGILGSVVTTKSITIQPQTRQLIQGLTHAAKGCCQQIHVLSEGAKTLPGGLVVSPGLQKLESRTSAQHVYVEINNHSHKEVTIPIRCKIGEVHQVEVVPVGSTLENQDSAEMEFPHMYHESLSSKLDRDKVQEVEQLLSKWRDVFSLHDLDLGHTHKVTHKIKLTDDRPFKERHRRIPPAMLEEVKKHLLEMLDLGVIRRSDSPYTSNVVLVRKKDGTLRFCIDFRQLNAVTVKDAYALPRIEETFDSLHSSKWFSTLDLKSAYWQVELAEEDKPKTAFVVGQVGFF